MLLAFGPVSCRNQLLSALPEKSCPYDSVLSYWLVFHYYTGFTQKWHSVLSNMGKKTGQEEGRGRLCPRMVAHGRCDVEEPSARRRANGRFRPVTDVEEDGGWPNQPRWTQPGSPLPQSGGGFKPQGVIHPAALSEFDELLAVHEPALRRAFVADHDERQEMRQCSAGMARAAIDALVALRQLLVDSTQSTCAGAERSCARKRLLEPLQLALNRVEAAKHAASEISGGRPPVRFSLASGALTALLWVTSTDPIRHVRDTLNALPTFGEQLQRQGPAHAEFVGVFIALLRAVLDYVHRWHPCGLGALTGAEDDATVCAVVEFDALTAEWLPRLLAPMNELGGGLEQLALPVRRAFEAQRRLLSLAATHRRPRGGIDTTDSASLLVRETEEALGEGRRVAKLHSLEPFRDHLAMVNCGLDALCWPATDNPPVFVSGVLNALPVCTEKVLAKPLLKRERVVHQQLADGLLHLLRALRMYVSRFHKSGLQWDPDGAELLVQCADGDRSTWCLSSALWSDAECGRGAGGRRVVL